MIRDFIANRKQLLNLMVIATLFTVLSSCDAGAQNGGTGGVQCTKCIDNKPPATPFSSQLNALNHALPISEGIAMTNRFQTKQDSILIPGLRGKNLLPMYETFNLKAIDSLICQAKAIGFRIYMAMDANNQVRFVLVGVDGDGKDIIQNTKENPGRNYATEGASILVDETGQRWP